MPPLGTPFICPRFKEDRIKKINNEKKKKRGRKKEWNRLKRYIYKKNGTKREGKVIDQKIEKRGKRAGKQIIQHSAHCCSVLLWYKPSSLAIVYQIPGEEQIESLQKTSTQRDKSRKMET